MRNLFVIASLLTLTTATSVQAQETRVGLGVGLTSSGFSFESILESAISPASIYVPIQLNSIRLEPEIGIFRVASEDGDFESSSTVLQLGTGVFVSRPDDRTNFYYGGRIGITRLSSEVDTPGGESESSDTNFFIGPAAGAEYYFVEEFSLGGEAQLLYSSVGGDDEDISLIRTRAVFFVRWYPWD